jgi:hypothetical protein
MSKKKTSSEKDGLSASQHDAIRLLAAGCTARYTAMVLKLKYIDVARWIDKDVAFQTELTVQAERQQTQPSQLTGQSQGKNIRADKSRRGDYEGDEPRTELASN